MKRPPSRGAGELPAPRRRRRGPSTPSASRRSATTSAGSNGIPMGSLESYKLISEVGGGAFGIVRTALQQCSRTVVAIKTPHRGGEDEVLREATLLAACRGNRGVVELVDVARGLDDATGDVDVHLVMEFAGPKDLRRVLSKRRRPFAEAQARRAMRQLLGGVKKMHARGVVHCDLKPENVLVRHGRLKICDFGLAVSESVPPLAGTGLQGTPTYMAPELLMGGTDRAPAVDMWSLGCVMAELVTGERLFRNGSHEVELGAKIIRFLGIPDDVSQVNLGVTTPSKLRDTVPEERLSQAGFDVLRGLLEYNPRDRLTAAAALKMPWFDRKSKDYLSPGRAGGTESNPIVID